MPDYLGRRIIRGVEFYEDPENLDAAQCARCGSSVEWVEDPTMGEAYEGGWYICLAGEEYCKRHPLPGREPERGAHSDE